MDQYSAKALIIALSIVSRLIFGFTPLLVSRKLLTNNPTDSLKSKTVNINKNNCRSVYII